MSGVALLVALLAAGDAAAGSAPVPTVRLFDSSGEALAAVLAGRPRVVAVGELHQTNATRKVDSAIKRFTVEMLPALVAARAGDIVVETWLTKGQCGEAEKKVVAQVARTTDRPAETENEVVTLLKRAKEGGLVPRILEVACKDYQALRGSDGLDVEKMLKLTSDQLHQQIGAALARSAAQPERAVVVYGGALHNDLRPPAGLEAFAFGAAVSAEVSGRYAEIDLYVPEFVDGNATVKKEAWYPAWKKAVRPGKVALVSKGPGAWAVVFARGSAAAAPPPPAPPTPPAAGSIPAAVRP